MNAEPNSPATPPEAANPYGNPQGRSRRSSAPVETPAEASSGGFGSPSTVALLLSLALVVWFGFQSFQLVKERDALEAARTAQEQTVQQATKLRGQLDAVARETKKLADAGNPNAKLLVDELRKRGITINPNPPGNQAAPTP